MTTKELIAQLKRDLPHGYKPEREEFARLIVNEQHSIQELSTLLFEKEKISYRFSWLLTDIGLYDKDYLFRTLPYLFSKRKEVTFFDFEEQFSTYWYYFGVPEENESDALDLLIHFLTNDYKVSTQSRSLDALLTLVEKYPELGPEVKMVAEGVRCSPNVSRRRKALLG